MATATIQFAFPKTTPTSLVDIPAPFIPPTNSVTPKSHSNPWGRISDMINWLRHPNFGDYPYGQDIFVALGVNVRNCGGGEPLCIDNSVNAQPGKPLAVSLKVGPGSDFYNPFNTYYGFLFNAYKDSDDRSLAMAICRGVTGPTGCQDPVKRELYIEFTNFNYGNQIVYLWIPGEWLDKPGKHQFTAYINYDQAIYPELVYHNNYIPFTVDVNAPSDQFAPGTGLKNSLTPTATPFFPDFQQNNGQVNPGKLTGSSSDTRNLLLLGTLGALIVIGVVGFNWKFFGDGSVRNQFPSSPDGTKGFNGGIRSFNGGVKNIDSENLQGLDGGFNGLNGGSKDGFGDGSARNQFPSNPDGTNGGNLNGGLSGSEKVELNPQPYPPKESTPPKGRNLTDGMATKD
jgi:hypothetical protein